MIVIAWNRLPLYAAYEISAAIDAMPTQEVVVIASRSSLPIEGIEEIIGQAVTWIDNTKELSWRDISLTVPDYFFYIGWAYAGFNSLAREVRCAGGKNVCLIDNCWKNNLRQWFGAAYYRVKLRSLHDFVIVPGESGRKFCRIIGQPNCRIFDGMYGANPDVFYPGIDVIERPKQLIFVGQMIERKGLPELAAAWKEFHAENSEWSLVAFGQGPLRSVMEDLPGVRTEDFQPAQRIAAEMRNSRALLLPSREEHWGLVVHEAALCGCALLCTENVGAVADLVGDRNGVLFAQSNPGAILRGLQRMASWNREQWRNASGESIAIASNFGPRRFAKSVASIVSLSNA